MGAQKTILTDAICSLLQDNFTQVWDPDVVVEAILPYVLDHRITTVCHRCPPPLPQSS